MRRSPVGRWIVVALWLASGCGAREPEAHEARRATLQGLFDRLPEPVVEDDGPPRLVLREGPSVPEPGRVEVPFPSPRSDAPPAPQAGDVEPLRVLSAHPQGEEALVGAVRVTFSQPMVPLAALGALRAREVPLRLHPQPPGRFRWLWTSTIAFEPSSEHHRMPGATQYTVRVPAGTRSALGGELAEDYVLRFSTPPPGVIETFPPADSDEQELRPLIGVRFDQRIDANAVARRMWLDGEGRSPLVVVPANELAALRERHPSLQAWEDDRQVLLRPESNLRRDTLYTVQVPAGTRGAEGPLPMRAPSSTPFRTFAPLRVVRIRCGARYGGGVCRPRSTMFAMMSTTIAPGQDLASFVEVEPAIADLEASSPGGRYIYIEGTTLPGTIYRITVRAGLRDIHGQRLHADATHEVIVGDERPRLALGAGRLATLELSSPRAYPIDAMNQRAVVARVASVPRDRIGAAIEGVEQGWCSWCDEPDPFRRARLRPSTRRLTTRSAPNVEERLGVPLGLPAGAPGVALVELQLPDDRGREYALVQATDLGIVSALDAFGGTVRVTSLSSGDPVEGARVRIFRAHTDSPPWVEATSGADGIARLTRGLGETHYRVVATTEHAGTIVMRRSTTRLGLRAGSDRGPDRGALRATSPHNDYHPQRSNHSGRGSML